MFQKYLTKTRKKGFTLIEMIVVIAIIAVLIALVAPLMTRYINTAKQTKADAAAKSLYTAAQAYVAEKVLDGVDADTIDSFTSSDISAIKGFLDNAPSADPTIDVTDGEVGDVTIVVDGVTGNYPRSSSTT